MLQTWTKDRDTLSRALDRAETQSRTYLFDAVRTTLPVASTGENTKKALLVISDGRDHESRTPVIELRQAIRESEVLVYALGIDGIASRTSQPSKGRPSTPPWGRGGRRGGFPPIFPQITWGSSTSSGDDGVDADALRRITDDTGGRTEIIHDLKDLDGATSRIADELSRQYSIGYTSPGLRDGKWHSIRVEVNDKSATVRARKGYISS